MRAHLVVQIVVRSTMDQKRGTAADEPSPARSFNELIIADALAEQTVMGGLPLLGK